MKPTITSVLDSCAELHDLENLDHAEVLGEVVSIICEEFIGVVEIDEDQYEAIIDALDAQLVHLTRENGTWTNTTLFNAVQVAVCTVFDARV